MHFLPSRESTTAAGRRGTVTSSGDSLRALAPFVGEWSMVAVFEDVAPADTGARAVFAWLTGERFLIQRWEVPVPEAPDGIAIIGLDPEREGSYLQHYFDTRGVARLYAMSFDGEVWKLWRDEADFSPLSFRQRFIGTFGDEGRLITGAWEKTAEGATWEHDFDLAYSKVG